MAYPTDIDDFRAVQDMPGVVYDPTALTTIFAEDVRALGDSIVAIETFLGASPFPIAIPVTGVIPYLLNYINHVYNDYQSIRPAVSVAYPVKYTFGGIQGAQWPATNPVMLVTGGHFGLTIGGVTTFYDIICTAWENGFGIYEVFFFYINSATRAIVAPPTRPAIGTPVGQDGFNWRFEWNKRAKPV